MQPAMTDPTTPSEFNDDELEPPVWLNGEFCAKVLQAQQENATLLHFSIRPASLKGDHYASLMFRVAMEYRRPHTTHATRLTVIVKTVPDARTTKGRNLSDSHLFANELHCYTEIIPRFEAIWRQCTGEAVQFAGRVLYGEAEPVPVIVLEDLCRSGYEILRERLFNRNEVHACLTKLAKWHAISHKATMDRSETPLLAATHDKIAQMQYGLFKARNLLATDYMRHGLSALIDAINGAATDGDTERCLLQPCVAKLRSWVPQLIAECETMNDAFVRGLRGPIYVLNHGDFHTKNIMIRRRPHGANDPNVDMLFVDFQMSFLGPSMYDLCYSSFTLLSKSLRDEKRAELMQYYFDGFVQALRKLHLSTPMPTYETFLQDHMRWRCFEIFLVSTFLPLTKLSDASDEPAVDINLIFTSAAYRTQFYRNPAYVAYLKELLPKYNAQGYLD